MKEIIFIAPIFVEKVWGGKKLKEVFNYNIPSGTTGECWAISGHKNGDCVILNDKYNNMTLSKLYKEYPKIFGGKTKDTFPLLVKILDAKEDLSVQVHPDDDYAKKNENDLGKSECWYILQCEENSDIVMGHNAKNKEEVCELIMNNKFDEFLNIIPIKNNDFFYVKCGTVHAIRKGTLIYELQQSSDTTYRIYDYNRLDNGKKRELHIEKSVEVIKSPQLITNTLSSKINDNVEKLISNEFFTLFKITNNGEKVYNITNKYLLVTVIKGEGVIDGTKITLGDNFIIPCNYGDMKIKGNVTLMVASE